MNFKKSGIVLLVLLAMAVMSMAATEDSEAKCPKKVAVVLQTIRPAIFLEYQFSSQGQAEIIAVKSPVKGFLSEIKVSEGSLVDAGQNLVVLNAGMSEEIKKLAADAAKKKKILTNREKWKARNEQAIQSAAKDYQKALDLLNENKTRADQVVKAPVAGIVHLVMAAGSETAVDTLLLEIANRRQMLFPIFLTASDKSSIAVGDKFIGTIEGYSGEVEAEVIAVSETKAVLGVNNNENQVKEGVTFTFKKLKAEHIDAIIIPTAAIHKDSLGDFVYVAEKKKAEKLYVALGKSRAGNTMVLKGLSADMALIISRSECLANGKKIRIVNQEEFAKEKAEAPAGKEEATIDEEKAEAQAKKEAEALDKEKAAALAKSTEKEETQAETKFVKIIPPDTSRFRVGLTFGRFSVNDKNMRTFYGDWFKNIPGIELSIHTLYNIDVWASYKIFSEEQTTTYFKNPVKFKLVPLSVGLRYRFPRWRFLEPFVGAGLNFYSFKETISGESALADTKESATGFHFQGGTYFHIDSFRFLLGEIFVKYNMVKKTLAELLPDGSDQLDLGGLEVGIGIVARF